VVFPTFAELVIKRREAAMIAKKLPWHQDSSKDIGWARLTRLSGASNGQEQRK
jgi:hypothetical protein